LQAFITLAARCGKATARNAGPVDQGIERDFANIAAPTAAQGATVGEP
jgi:hypothetical protein